MLMPSSSQLSPLEIAADSRSLDGDRTSSIAKSQVGGSRVEPIPAQERERRRVERRGESREERSISREKWDLFGQVVREKW